MAKTHVADIPLAGSVESGLRLGAALPIVADGDLAGSQAAALAAIDVKVGKLHVSQKQLAYGVKKSVELVSSLEGGSTLVTGGSLANIYASVLFPGDWAAGFTPVC